MGVGRPVLKPVPLAELAEEAEGATEGVALPTCITKGFQLGCTSSSSTGWPKCMTSCWQEETNKRLAEHHKARGIHKADKRCSGCLNFPGHCLFRAWHILPMDQENMSVRAKPYHSDNSSVEIQSGKC